MRFVSASCIWANLSLIGWVFRDVPILGETGSRMLCFKFQIVRELHVNRHYMVYYP